MCRGGPASLLRACRLAPPSPSAQAGGGADPVDMEDRELGAYIKGTLAEGALRRAVFAKRGCGWAAV
jgi:hypothetical protein